MKNKKLFAILTLVCFMFTLMPVAAFAADASATLDKNSVDTTQAVTVTIENAAVTGSYYVFAIDENDKLYGGLTAAGETVVNGVVINAMTAGANDTVAVKFADAGVYEVLVAQTLGAGMDSIVNGTIYEDADVVLSALLRGAEKVDMQKNNTVRVKAVATSYTIAVVDAEGNPLSSGSPDYDYAIASGIKADNGFTSPVYTVVLAKADTTPVKYDKVTYSTNSGYLKVVEVDSETDKYGKADFRLAATKAGDYKVTVSYGKTVKTIGVTVGTNGIAGVATVDAPKTPVALETALTSSYNGVVFELTDANGSVMTQSVVTGADAQVAVVKKPVDSKIGVDTKFQLKYVTSAGGYVVEKMADYTGFTNGVNNVFDAEGDYVIRVALANGATAMANVTVKEFGEPVAMTVVYKQATIGLGAKAEVKAVTLLDANKTAKTIFANGAYTDPFYNGKLEFVANGIAVKECANGRGLASDVSPAVSADGTIEVKSLLSGIDEEKLIGTTINALVIYDDLELIASASLEVVDTEAALKFIDTTADIAVNNALEVVLVDASGKEVDVNFASGDALKVYVLEAPANAKYDINGRVDTTNDELSVDFTVSAPGEYKLQSVLTYGGGYLTSVDTIVVGGTVDTFKDVVVLSMGAKSMIVNDEIVTLDVAPFVAEGRTMMQYTALKAFGIEFNWDGVDTVTAEGNGVKVVMTIGSKVATVNGKVVNMEVAPTIIDGRTVIPVTYATNPFGIVATALYDANGVSDVLFTAK